MDIISGLNTCQIPRSVVVIGNFDGCHLGHRKLLEEARALADDLGAKAVALTFKPHPEVHFGKLTQEDLLFSEDLKLAAFAATGMDVVVLQAFDDTFMKTSHVDFYEHLLKGRLGAKAIVVGENFRFGYNRLGSGDWMQEQADGVRVIVGTHVENAEGVISSTLVRQLLRDGDVRKAMTCLGRPYALSGSVKQGQQKGREIGIPTLNLHDTDQLLPGHGVYAGFVSLEGVTPDVSLINPKLHDLMPAVFNIGVRPTVSGVGVSVEGHVLDQTLSVAYGKTSRFFFVEHLRGEKKFPSFEDLRQQIGDDIQQARRLLHIEL